MTTECQNLKVRDVARDFYSRIPDDPSENVGWRLDLYKRLGESESERKDFLSLCSAYYPILFKSLLWTFNPKNPPNARNVPFIPRYKQLEVIDDVIWSIEHGEPIVIDKSRDEGATWLILGVLMCFWLFVPDCQFLVASRKEEYVDRTGDHKTLFAKMIYLFDKLPVWLKKPIEKTHMHLANKANGSVIDGEATNENLGAGDRRTAVLLDEFGRVDPNIAACIKDTITDVTDCVIYNSTHFYGENHAYNRVLVDGKVKVVVLGWEHNPEKNYGLYSSPDLDIIQIHDIDYWRKVQPVVFNDIQKDQKIKASQVEWQAVTNEYKPYKFVADGKGILRSPWYDKQERNRSPKDLAMNVNRDPCGGSGGFFDSSVISRHVKDSRKPDFEGEVTFSCHEDEILDYRWQGEYGKKRLKWWGSLDNGIPNQEHNYIVGCDISMGTGASHSAVTIYDVNTREKVGRWVCAQTEPLGFAEQVVAICKWLGGVQKPFLIWEANGGQGMIFDRRVRALGYSHVYYQKDERITYRPEGQKRGWHSSRTSKQDLLTLYRAALHLRYTTGDGFINYDEDSLRQCRDYVYLSGGAIGPSVLREADDEAKATHGDMVIADALCVLAMNDQPAAVGKKTQEIRENTQAWRQRQYRLERNTIKESAWLN